MSWDSLVFGELEFPPGGLAKWKEAPIGDDPEGWSVGTWLDELEAVSQVARVDFVDVKERGDHIELRGFLEKSRLAYLREALVSMFEIAGRLGATGALTIIGASSAPSGMGTRLEVGPGGARTVALSEAEEDALRASPTAREIEARATRRLEEPRAQPLPATTPAPSGAPAAKKAGAKKSRPKASGAKAPAAKKAASKEPAAKKSRPNASNTTTPAAKKAGAKRRSSKKAARRATGAA